jgi:hypothetical protein
MSLCTCFLFFPALARWGNSMVESLRWQGMLPQLLDRPQGSAVLYPLPWGF